MKSFVIALSFVAALGVSACSNTQAGDWTPMSAGRTAGDGVVKVQKPAVKHHKADRMFSDSLRK